MSCSEYIVENRYHFEKSVNSVGKSGGSRGDRQEENVADKVLTAMQLVTVVNYPALIGQQESMSIYFSCEREL